MSPRSHLLLSLAVAALTLTACSRSQNETKVPLAQASNASVASAPDAPAMPAAERTALDLGNSEYRAARYESALKAYRDASKAAPGDAAPYFGVYMVAQKMGNKALADSANKAINAHSGSAPALSDSAMKELHQGAIATKPK